MYWIPALVLLLILGGYTIYKNGNWTYVILPLLAGILLSALIVFIDYSVKTTDTEVWSGRVVDWKHIEEWDEWHPPVTTCSSDGNGNETCSTTPGYYEHHDAENYIVTTDGGSIFVSQAPDGTSFDDNYPNHTEELMKYWPYGTPTASTHTYVNKVKASYSIYKHKDIDVSEFPDLPDYPKDNRDYINIDRIIGDVPKRDSALQLLAEKNAELNKMIPDPVNPGKKRSWKQVNMIFVNVGADKPIEYGYALQDKWQGGNKNDFVVAFSLNDKNQVDWVYPFSWSEVEILKLEVRDYLLNLQEIDDFNQVVEDVSVMVANKFERKEFADFNYLQIEASPWVSVVIVILHIVIGIAALTKQSQYIHERKWR